MGHEATLALSKEEALRRVRTESFELLILDRDEIGLEPLIALRSVPWSENVLAILLQDSGTDQYLFETYHSGADMVLHKPLNPSELRTLVHRR